MNSYVKLCGFVRLALQCDECHKDILCFDLTSESVDAIVVIVRFKHLGKGKICLAIFVRFVGACLI